MSTQTDKATWEKEIAIPQQSLQSANRQEHNRPKLFFLVKKNLMWIILNQFLASLSVAGACSAVPEASGLLVSLSAASSGDGSECFPFSSMDSALGTTLALPSATLSVLATGVEGEITIEANVAGAVTLLGHSETVWIKGKITVTGTLTIVELTIKQDGGRTDELLSCTGGTLQFSTVHTIGGTRTLLDMHDGSFSAVSSQFLEFQTTVFKMRRTAGRLQLTAATISNAATVVEVFALATESAGAITFSGVEVTGIENLIAWKGLPGLAFSIAIEDSVVRGAQQSLIQGNIAGIDILVSNLTVTDSQQVIVGKLLDVSASFTDCTFERISDRPFDLSALQGNLLFQRCFFSEIQQGPVVLLPSNSYPLALVSLSDCVIANTTNYGYSGLAIVFVGMLVNFHMENCEVKDSAAIEGGLFSLTAGSALLTNVYYHDCSIVVFSFFESISSDVTLKDLTMQRTASDIVALTMCIAGSSCNLLNVTIVDTWDPNLTRARNFVLVWSGVDSVATLAGCYFRNLGYSDPALAVTERGVIHVYNTTFADLTNNDAFDSMQDGFILFDNVTFIRPTVKYLFWCGMTKTCYNISRVKVEGEFTVSIVLYADGGRSVVTDSTFEGFSDSVFRVMNGELIVNRVTITNQRSFVCRGCMNSYFAFSNLTVINVFSSMIFQFSYSTIVFSDLVVRNVISSNFLELDVSDLSFVTAHLSNIEVDSSGGLITAASSTVSIKQVTATELRGLLSIRIGIIYIDGSQLRLDNCHISRFNSTLVYAVQSNVEIVNSAFADGGLYDSTESKPVVSYGTVLWGSFSSATVSASRFTNLSADDGGVLYFAGSGTETCTIDGCVGVRNSAKNRGGFIYANSVIVSISQSEFRWNSAVQGGAVYVKGSGSEHLTTIVNAVFCNNSAVKDGGAFMRLHSSSRIEYSDWLDNSAVYGPNFATEFYELRIVSANSQALENYTVNAVSGQLYEGTIVIGLFDEIEQIIATDDSSKLTLFTVDTNSSLVGTTLLNVKQGLFTMSGIAFIGNPLSILTVYGTVGTHTQALFRVWLRDCVMGEFLHDNECTLCTNNMYSFSPTTPCRLCPSKATCPSGYRMVLNRGYWRQSLTDDNILACLVPELCLGGFESECASGHSGVMCSACTDNHFKVNQLQCTTCENKGLSAFKGILALVLSVNSVLFVMSKSRDRLMVHAVIADYMHTLRILVNYNIYWPSSVSYLYTILGDVSSIGLTSFTDPCLGAITNISTLFSQLIVSLLYFVLATIGIGAMAFTIRFFYHGAKRLLPSRTAAYAAYLMLPMVFIRVLQMFPCYSVGGDQFLIYNSTIECWTDKHLAYSLALSLPIFLLALALPFVLLTGALRNAPRALAYLPKWQYFFLSLFLFRKYALTCILLFSDALTLPAQVSVVVFFNLATEAAINMRVDSRHMFFSRLYSSTLAATTVLSIACAIYWASTSMVTDKESAFVLVNYFSVAIPFVYVFGFVASRRLFKHSSKIIVPACSSSIGQPASGVVDPRSIVLNDSNNASQDFLIVPHPTPIQQ